MPEMVPFDLAIEELLAQLQTAINGLRLLQTDVIRIKTLAREKSIDAYDPLVADGEQLQRKIRQALHVADSSIATMRVDMRNNERSLGRQTYNTINQFLATFRRRSELLQADYQRYYQQVRRELEARGEFPQS